jgi:hypothetical protein
MINPHLFCLSVALAMRMAFDQAIGQQAPINHPTPNTHELHTYVLPGKVAIEWKFYEETRVWLSINSFDSKAWYNDGYNPSFTYIMSTALPVVKKLSNGQYQISFTSELTKDLP